jgi:MoaD family protein
MSAGSAGSSLAPDSEVVVSFFATMRDAFGSDEVSVPLERAGSVRDLLDGLCTTPGRERAVRDERGALRRDLTLLVNGHHIGALGGLDTPLKSGDVVSVFPQLFGG